MKKVSSEIFNRIVQGNLKGVNFIGGSTMPFDYTGVRPHFYTDFHFNLSVYDNPNPRLLNSTGLQKFILIDLVGARAEYSLGMIKGSIASKNENLSPGLLDENGREKFTRPFMARYLDMEYGVNAFANYIPEQTNIYLHPSFQEFQVVHRALKMRFRNSYKMLSSIELAKIL